MAKDAPIYRAEMGNPPMPDEGAPPPPRKASVVPPPPPRKVPPKPAPRRSPDPADAGIYTAEMGNPPMPDEGPIRRKAKGGSVSSASKRADGCAQRGKTRGRFV